MDFPPELLHYLVCPSCQGDLRPTKEQVLFCIRCRVCYPVDDGIPTLTLDAAIPLTGDGRLQSKKTIAVFTVESGIDDGLQFRLDQGTCKAVGKRAEGDFEANGAYQVVLDEHSRKLIRNYLLRTSGKKGLEDSDPEQLGPFRRLPDLILQDSEMSRLHAMVFHDGKEIGVLDLVSRTGTYVNGREVEASLIRPGDLIQIGSTKIRYMKEE